MVTLPILMPIAIIMNTIATTTTDPGSRAWRGSDGGAAFDAGTRDGAVTNDGAGAESVEAPRPLRYRVQFTASQELVDLLQEAADLLGHEHPRPSLPDIQLRALRALVKELRARKRAATGRPRRSARSKSEAATDERSAPGSANDAPGRLPSPADPANDAPERVSPRSSRDATARSHTRHIPAPERRAVWARDGARCAYVDDRGKRCCETCGLEVHHRHAHALGGPPTLRNLELRCRAHNTLAAEEDFGREHMARMRGADDAPAPARARPSCPQGSTSRISADTSAGSSKLPELRVPASP